MKKSRKLKVDSDFKLSRGNFAAWGADVTASVLPFFVSKECNQTPVVAVGKSVGKRQQRALVRAFRRQRERVTVTNSIPRGARCVAVGLSVDRSGCAVCGQPAKVLSSRIAFFVDGVPVEFDGKPRTSPTACSACGHIANPDPEPRDILEALDAF